VLRSSYLHKFPSVVSRHYVCYLGVHFVSATLVASLLRSTAKSSQRERWRAANEDEATYSTTPQIKVEGKLRPVSVSSYKFLSNYGNRSEREWTANTADLGQTPSTRQQRTASHSLITALCDAVNYVVTPNRNFSELIISRQVLLRVRLYCDA
jgi:hypothetical protein